MISVIRPDMAAKVIEPPKAETQDDKDLGAKWVKFFIIFGGMLAASAAFFAHQVITGGRFLGTSAMLMASAFAMLLYVTAKYINVRVMLPKKFNKAVDKYGRDNLIAQLSETSTLGFFIVEDFYDNLLILTKDYVLSANEFVIALSEIREMVVSKVDIYEEGVKKMHDERRKNILRCVYAMELTMADGSRRRQLFAISSYDLNPFFGYVNQRAPHIKFGYKST